MEGLGFTGTAGPIILTVDIFFRPGLAVGGGFALVGSGTFKGCAVVGATTRGWVLDDGVVIESGVVSDVGGAAAGFDDVVTAGHSAVGMTIG